MDDAGRTVVATWLGGLSPSARLRLYELLDEVNAGLDVSRHNRFGFQRLRAEFETSGELLGCSLAELRDAVGATFGEGEHPTASPRSALDALRTEVARQGHPDFR